MDLIDRLIDKQGTKHQREFAAELGIDQGLLSRLLRREISLGPKTGKRIAKAYPEWADEVAAFFLADDMNTVNGEHSSPDGNGKEPVNV